MATDYQALLDAQSNPYLALLSSMGYQYPTSSPTAPTAPPPPTSSPYPGYTYNPSAQQFINDSTGQAMVDGSGQPYRTGQLDQYGHDLTYVSDVDAMMAAAKRQGLTGIGLALAGGVTGGLLSGLGAGAATGATGDVGTNGYGISSDFLPGGAGDLSPITLPASASYIGSGAASQGALAGIGSSLGAGAPVSSLLTTMPDFGASLGGLGGITSSVGAASGADQASNLFSGGADPNAPPNLVAPGAQTPGGYGLPSGTQIPNLPGANMASALPSWLQSLLPYSSLIGGGLGLVDSLLQPNQKTSTGGGTSNSTNSTSLQLPSQLTGGAGGALDRANHLLSQGYQVAPLGSAFDTAQNQLTNLPQNNAPTTSSFASGANINPYLDQTFNAAADATQNRLATEFANAGQINSPQDQQARSQQLQQLAAGIYGPGYQNAQQLQYGAQESGVTRGLQQQDANINRTLQANPLLQQIGMTQQQQAQNQLNAPTTGLNQYIGQLGGLSPYFPGTTNQSQSTNQTGNVTQPLYNNPLSSVAGGAILGNYVGNIFGPQQQGNSNAGLQKPQQMTSQPLAGQWY